jgi:hypothetical protein
MSTISKTICDFCGRETNSHETFKDGWLSFLGCSSGAKLICKEKSPLKNLEDRNYCCVECLILAIKKGMET